MVLQAGAHEAHVQPGQTHTNSSQCLQAEVPLQPQPCTEPSCCTGARQLQQQLQSSPCVVQSRDSARNSCSNAYFLQTQKDKLLGGFSTLATQRWHLTVCCFKWWTEMKIWKYVYVYIHRHIYTHLHVSILYTEVRYRLTPQNCFWKLLKIFRTVPTDLIRQLCRVENISKSTLGTCPSELNQKVLSCWTQEEAAASTGTAAAQTPQQGSRTLPSSLGKGGALPFLSAGGAPSQPLLT